MPQALDVVAEPVRFHLSLSVPDLPRAVAFYRALFGAEPAKLHADYAKFQLDDPPLVFSLAPHPPGPGASLSHLGLRVGSDAAIQSARERLEAAGVCTEAQDGTVCGYARQNKLWARDPFGNFWEVYRVEGDIPPESVRRSVEGAAARADAEACAPGPESGPGAPAVWEHFVTGPAPERIPHPDGTLDEVRLVGTFNADLTPGERDALLREAARALKVGGKVLVHGLMADAPLPGSQPKLPGLAAMVARVPAQAEPIDALARAGFVGAQFVKYDKPWFTHDGVGLREAKLVAWNPAEATGTGGVRRVLYKGPFARATADGGRVFARGERAEVPAALWDQLRLGPAAEQFLFFEPGESACSAPQGDSP